MRLLVNMQEGDSVLPAVFRDVQQLTAVLDSPHFTGVPTAPTPPSGTNNDQLATTAFVIRSIADSHFGYGNIVTLNISEVTS